MGIKDDKDNGVKSGPAGLVLVFSRRTKKITNMSKSHQDMTSKTLLLTANIKHLRLSWSANYCLSCVLIIMLIIVNQATKYL